MNAKEAIRNIALATVLATGASACSEEAPRPTEKVINPPEPTSLVFVPELTPVPNPITSIDIPFVSMPPAGDIGGDGGAMFGGREGPLEVINIYPDVQMPQETGKNKIGLFSEILIDENGLIDLGKPSEEGALQGEERSILLPKDSFLVLEGKAIDLMFGVDMTPEYMGIDFPADFNKTNTTIIRGASRDVFVTFRNYLPNTIIRTYNGESNSFVNESSFKDFVKDKETIVTLFDLETTALTVFSDGKLISTNLDDKHTGEEDSK